eukprot:CAMPEP_0175900504 /NCGR_PEP_ID=MMETSP0108-20121206/2367_1 /TAXON_ID=195067 ORGANISM="Goniomonas pacifica, Strain CCMP1869" /NCGR_SAMPLE_ID=MMETSP0108 /ASSEMBLY_ACC=CAM_ASM_000204 /LENGTH=164 /DNA_ID=CAMNT_0017222031 /DNA_START=1 /DNA_END=495 /DNA_ORIENTATION=-
MPLRVVAQLADEVSLLLDNIDTWGTRTKALVLYVGLIKDVGPENVTRAAQGILQAEWIRQEGGAAQSALQLGLNIVVIPQASLAGKVKGKKMQSVHPTALLVTAQRYHAQVEKEASRELYAMFCDALQAAAAPQAPEPILCGTFGNRQGLRLASAGPLSHFFEF